ncbi:MAG: uracil phosphoribosyltransferase [Coriobacteriia bacterium]|nr:uracil phosphoribosyltransferase [Coriobacteriia bacterium]MCL2745786.1 uracil phosphoribosyltransferase [Coriobacteriia bacterium]MCL2870261.1 uracil phosphoribosyltransferase [Coriobacteriia bacterium]
MSTNILNHPLIDHKLSLLRGVGTSTKDFRELTSEISTMVVYEALHDAPTVSTMVKTPMGRTKGSLVDSDNFVFVPVLRAGLGMTDGVLQIMPNAKFGHIGMERNENTLEPRNYYFKMPRHLEARTVCVLDPMLATGGSASAAITELKKAGATKIKLLVILAAPEGIERVEEDHPDIEIYTAAVDEYVNNAGYIVPGLGDAGDRIYGTA